MLHIIWWKILFAREYHCTIIIWWKILFAHEYPHLKHAHHWCKWPHQCSTVHFQSASWVASLPLPHPAMQTRSPSGCLTAPSWNSESLRGCGYSCHAPPPSTTQSGCTSRCLRPPSSGYTCEHKCKICLDSMYHNAISTCEWEDCKRVVIPIEAFVTNSSHVQDCHHVPLGVGLGLNHCDQDQDLLLVPSYTWSFDGLLLIAWLQQFKGQNDIHTYLIHHSGVNLITWSTFKKDISFWAWVANTSTADV